MFFRQFLFDKLQVHLNDIMLDVPADAAPNQSVTLCAAEPESVTHCHQRQLIFGLKI